MCKFTPKLCTIYVMRIKIREINYLRIFTWKFKNRINKMLSDIIYTKIKSILTFLSS